MPPVGDLAKDSACGRMRTATGDRRSWHHGCVRLVGGEDAAMPDQAAERTVRPPRCLCRPLHRGVQNDREDLRISVGAEDLVLARVLLDQDAVVVTREVDDL